MAILNILCSDPHNFLKEVRKEAHKKIFSHQKFSKDFMAHQYLPKIFHGPCKNLPPLSVYLMYGPLYFSVIFLRKYRYFQQAVFRNY